MTQRIWGAWSAVFLLFIAMSSIQISASMAKALFAYVPPQGVTALRLLFSSLILLSIFRPWRKPLPVGSWKSIVLYGASLGLMNLSFYMAIARIPLGIAVALEFIGPLAVAMFGARRVVDFCWVGLAVLGLWVLLPIRESVAGVDPVGAMYALLAGMFWGLYIIFGKRAGTISGSVAVALGSSVGAMMVIPVGLVTSGLDMFSMAVLPGALMLGIFSSALPYGLEIIALARLPARTFGILMSLEPALAAFSGYMFLGESLSLEQWLALGCVIIASAGATLTIRR